MQCAGFLLFVLLVRVEQQSDTAATNMRADMLVETFTDSRCNTHTHTVQHSHPMIRSFASVVVVGFRVALVDATTVASPTPVATAANGKGT